MGSGALPRALAHDAEYLRRQRGYPVRGHGARYHWSDHRSRWTKSGWPAKITKGPKGRTRRGLVYRSDQMDPVGDRRYAACADQEQHVPTRRSKVWVIGHFGGYDTPCLRLNLKVHQTLAAIK